MSGMPRHRPGATQPPDGRERSGGVRGDATPDGKRGDPPGSEGTFRTGDGLDLFYRAWRPTGPPRGVLVFVHGFGEHSGLYGGAAAHLVGGGYLVYALDQRGHGRSPGARGYVGSWDDFRGDLATFITVVQEAAPSCPIFLVGNSMGSAIVLEYVLSGLNASTALKTLKARERADGIRGVVAASAPLGAVGVPVWRLALGRFLSRVWPRFSLNAKLDLRNLTRDIEAGRAIVEDPLFHQRGSARLLTEFEAAKARVFRRAAEFPLPLLLLHGSADRIAPPEGGRTFFDAVCFADKERKEYAGAAHNLFHETNRQEVLDDVEAWLARHLAPA